jgi:hypothetical protein
MDLAVWHEAVVGVVVSAGVEAAGIRAFAPYHEQTEPAPRR